MLLSHVIEWKSERALGGTFLWIAIAIVVWVLELAWIVPYPLQNPNRQKALSPGPDRNADP